VAITSIADLLAGLRPVTVFTKAGVDNSAYWRLHSSSYYGPNPAVLASVQTGEALTSWPGGQIAFPPAVAGQSIYLAELEAYHSTISIPFGMDSVVIYDRLWHAGLFDDSLLTVQTVDSVAWPARDRNGSTDGEGVIIFLEYPDTIPTYQSQYVMNYTNSTGVSGRVGTAQAAPVSGPRLTDSFTLQAGDTGVRSVQSIQNIGGAGSAARTVLWAGRKIVHMPMQTDEPTNPNGYGKRGALAMGLPKLWDDSVPVPHYCVIGGSTNLPIFDVRVRWAQG
jgi:hypothetical protein